MDEPSQTEIQDAEDGTEFKLGAFPNPPVDHCPITFLGYYEGRVVFAMPEGEIRDIGTGDVTRLIQVDLFNTVEGQSFLAYWRDAEDKFQRNLAAIWFIRQCREAGYWESSRPQRSLGVWPGQDGEVILHCGNELRIYRPGELVEVKSVAKALREIGNGPIYKLRGKTPTPHDPCSADAGRWVREQLDLWRFEPIGEDGLTGADLVAGWLTASLLGAVAPFRPHLLIYAMPGSGKTTLVYFVHALISALAGDVIDAFTRAGLANDLGGMARPVMIDEAEAAPSAMGPGPVEQALELIRRMATGAGAVRKMGDIGGGSVTQTAVGAVFLAAVNPVKLGPADASRIAEARMLTLTGPMAAAGPAHRLATDAELRAVTDKAKKLAPALLGRVLMGADRFLADAAQIKAAFARQGRSPRAADLVSALAAGRRLLMENEPLDEKAADDEARFWSGLLDVRDQADVTSNTGQDCLAHLFNWTSGQHVHDRVITIGELIKKCASVDSDGDWHDGLKELGLIVSKITGEDGVKRTWLCVANKHPALERMFERTVWRDWRKALSFLDELGEDYATRPSNKALRFGMIVQRALCLPLDPWLVTRVTAGGPDRYSQANE